MVGSTHARYLPYLYAIVAPAVATLLGYGVESLIHKGNISLLYLLAVLLVASRSSYKPALVCALTSFVLYNVFFTEPRLSLIMTHSEDILTVVFFVVVALVAGHQAVLLRRQIDSLQTQEHFLKVQLQLAITLQETLTEDSIVAALRKAIEEAFAEAISIEQINFLPQKTSKESQLVRLTDSHYQLHFSNLDLGLDIQLQDKTLDEQWSTVLDTLFQQAKLAIARSQMAEQMQNERLRAEQEHLRSALLASVSHDLKTPLASMIGAASSLKELEADLSEADKKDLLDSLLEEARRLEGYIQNLLDMTRLGQGELTLSREWIGIDEIIHVVVKRAKQIQGERKIDIQLSPKLPFIYVHPALIEQALFNVLENAIKFSPARSTIIIKVDTTEEYMRLDVIDQGPGIPNDQRSKVFDMFHSVSRGDYHPAGTGLGLAICQGMLGAHGGKAEVIAPDGGKSTGACIRLLIPLLEDTSNDIKEVDTA